MHIAGHIEHRGAAEPQFEIGIVLSHPQGREVSERANPSVPGARVGDQGHAGGHLHLRPGWKVDASAQVNVCGIDHRGMAGLDQQDVFGFLAHIEFSTPGDQSAGDVMNGGVEAAEGQFG